MGAISPPQGEGAKRSAIDVDGLSVRYHLRRTADAVTAVDGVSLSVQSGRFCTLIGPSGCGKTTLLKAIAGLVEPTDGSVGTYCGGSGGRHTLGILFQKPLLLPWRTALENVLLPVDVASRRGSDDVERATELLVRVGLGSFTRAYPHELSAGMQQRVAIARTLLPDPPILLMDEPFSALDELTRESMNLELLRIWERSGKTIVFVTHNVAEAVFLSDEIHVMREGGVLADRIEVDLPRPRTTAVTASPRYAERLARARRALGLDR